MRYSLLAGASLASAIALAQPVFAGSLQVQNKSDQTIYLNDTDPNLGNPSATVAAGGSTSLDSGIWVENQPGAKNIYMTIAKSNGGADICAGSAIGKNGYSQVPMTGVLTITSDDQCIYSADNPDASISWSADDAHASATVDASTGNGTLTFSANAIDSSGAAITYAADVQGRGKIGDLTVKDGVITAPLSGFAGISSDAENIQISASAADVKQATTVSVPVKTTGQANNMTPYRQINVGEDYVGQQMTDIIHLGGYLPGDSQGKFSASISRISPEFSQTFSINADGVLKIQSGGEGSPAISTSQFEGLSGCSAYTNRLGQADSNIKQCLIGVTDASSGKEVNVPVLINNGLRTLSAPELVNKHINHNGSVIGPNYFEIALKGSGSDLSVDLHNYTADAKTANTGIRFIPDDALVIGQSASDTNPSATSNFASGAVSDISALGHAKHGSLEDFGFAISSEGVLSNSGKMQAGHIYQINLAAVTGDAVDTTGKNALEKSYVTLYVYDNSTVSFGDWQSGKVPSTSLLKTVNGNQPLSMIYTYSHADPVNNMDGFSKIYQQYINDIHYGNQHADNGKPMANPINVMALESAGPMYTDSAPYWITKPSESNVKNQIIKSNALSNGQGNPANWMPQLIDMLNPASTASDQALNVSPDLTFGQNVRAAFSTYNFEQLDMLTNEIMNNYVYFNHGLSGSVIDNLGINLDLEKGTDMGYAPIFSMIANKLAYNGMFFGYYEFADKAFQPAIVGAMGPLGVAFVSSYDVGGDGSQATRASSQQYEDQGMNQQATQDLYNLVYHVNQSCNSGSGDPVNRYSWCNLSMSDSNAVNQIAWDTTADAPNQYNMSTHQVFNDFNGNYSVTQPFAESSTDFSYQELFNPNFSNNVDPHAHNVVQAGGGLVLTNPQACSDLDNTWMVSHQDELLKAIQGSSDEATREKDPAYKQLATCLFANIKLSNNGAQAIPVTKINYCGNQPGTTTPVPLGHCVLLSGIPSGNGDGSQTLSYPTPKGYMLDNAKPYMINGQLDPHMVGYSMFALQDTESAPQSGGFYWQPAGPGNYNIAVQEPWYVGGYQFNSADAKPDYSTIVQNKSAYDPFYDSSESQDAISSAWSGAAEIQKQFNSES